MSSIPEARPQAAAAGTNRPRSMPWRLRALRWHRALALVAAVTLVAWGGSGLLHPLLTTFGPQQRVFYPPAVPLLLAGDVEIHDILERASIDAAAAIRVVGGASGALLQVTEDRDARRPRRYFSLADGSELPGHDAVHAEFLARHYLALPTAAVAEVARIDSFDAVYPAINRLLPVYRVRFERADRLTAYVHTETGALAAVDDRFKQRVQTLFQWLHTWSWLPSGLEWLRVGAISLAMTTVLGMMLTGVVMRLKMRHAQAPAGARRWHRALTWALLLPTLGFTLSGLYHLLHQAGAAEPTGPRLSQPLTTATLAFPLRADWTTLTAGLDVRGLSLVRDAGGRVLYRLELAPDAAAPSGAQAIRNARFDGVPRNGPALYLDAASGVPWADGDRELALQLGDEFSGRPREELVGAHLVTRFGPRYDFRNKRLPVWQLDYGPPLDTALFIDTRTGVLADLLPRAAGPERLSFSFLHKWNFLFPFGRTVQNLAITVTVLLVVVGIAGLGLRLYPAAQRLRRRASRGRSAGAPRFSGR